MTTATTDEFSNSTTLSPINTTLTSTTATTTTIGWNSGFITLPTGYFATPQPPNATNVSSAYFALDYYYFFICLLFLLCIVIAILKFALQRRQRLQREANLIRLRARRQAEINAVTNSTNNNNNSNTTDLSKNSDLPPAYDDVVQAYILAKMQQERQPEGVVGNNLINNRVAAVSTVTIDTDIGDECAAGPIVPIATTANNESSANQVLGKTMPPPPSYDYIINNNNTNNSNIV